MKGKLEQMVADLNQSILNGMAHHQDEGRGNDQDWLDFLIKTQKTIKELAHEFSEINNSLTELGKVMHLEQRMVEREIFWGPSAIKFNYFLLTQEIPLFLLIVLGGVFLWFCFKFLSFLSKRG
jgi:hypothetical protein